VFRSDPVLILPSSAGLSSDFSSRQDLVFSVDSAVCVLVVTLSRASVPVRPAASCFPLHGHAAGQRISGSAGVCWCPSALLLLGLVPVKLFL
jgi:hypothetical protein